MSANVVTVTLRRYGSRFADSAYGITAYGTTPFGGSEYPAEIVGGLLQGSDIPQDQLGRQSEAIVHRRAGVPIAVRTDPVSGRVWRFNFLHSLHVLEQLRVFWTDRYFWLLPDGPNGIQQVLVLRQASESLPDYDHNDGLVEYYNLPALFEEIVV